MKSFMEHESKSAIEILGWAAQKFGQKVALASSFGLEDMVLIDMISELNQELTVFTLDTGRLHEETYDFIDRVRLKYDMTIKTYFPDRQAVEQLVLKKGFYSFRESLENRKECCAIRKVEPLNRALAGLDAWVTGLRRDQGVTRTHVQKIEEDKDHPPLIKICPLADWSQNQIVEYIEARNIPVNRLHKMNYPSIGCAPCTRAIEPGEDPRAGRWWWENPENKECGLHRS